MVRNEKSYLSHYTFYLTIKLPNYAEREETGIESIYTTVVLVVSRVVLKQLFLHMNQERFVVQRKEKRKGERKRE